MSLVKGRSFRASVQASDAVKLRYTRVYLHIPTELPFCVPPLVVGMHYSVVQQKERTKLLKKYQKRTRKNDTLKVVWFWKRKSHSSKWNPSRFESRPLAYGENPELL